ncbi:MAG: hypothetical protein H0X47_12980 [Nitrospirales bacterium]|nr:hypothetical protein [Nitrospirales bacterium]
MTISYLAQDGIRREVSAYLTYDHPTPSARISILIRGDTHEAITPKAWKAGEYRIEDANPTDRVFAECAVLRKPDENGK